MGNLFSLANVNTILSTLADIQGEITLLRTLIQSVKTSQLFTSAQINSVHTGVNNIHSSFTTNALAAGTLSNPTVAANVSTPSSSSS